MTILGINTISAVCESPKREPTSKIALVKANGGSSHKCAPTDIKFVDLLPEHQVAEHLLGGLFQNNVDAKSLFI